MARRKIVSTQSGPTSYRFASPKSARLLFKGIVMGTPFVLGGSRPEYNAVVALLVLAAAGLAVVGGMRRQLPRSLVLTALAVALAATCLQLLPMPIALLAHISPGTHAVLSLALAPDAWAPLSLDLSATAHEVLKLVVLLAGAVVVRFAFLSCGRGAELIPLVVLSAAAVFLSGFIHLALGLDRTYGLLRVPPSTFPTPFVNSNHATGYLGLGGFCAFALASEGRRWRVAWVITGLALASPLLVPLASGGGMLAYLAALMVGLLIWVWRARSAEKVQKNATIRPLGLRIAAVIAALVAGFLAYWRASKEIWIIERVGAFDKTVLWGLVPEMLADFPFLGIGRGAFGSASTRYIDFPLTLRFSHIENEPLQALVDWGPVVGGAVLLMLLLAGLRACGRQSRPRDLWVVTGLLFISGHNLVDFSLTLTSVGLVVVALFLHLETTSVTAPKNASCSSRRAWLLLTAALTVLAILGSAYAWIYRPERDGERFRAILVAVTSAKQRRRAAVPILRRHPADFFLPLLAAEKELGPDGDMPAAMRWINHAMYLAPTNPWPHRLAARALARLGHRQQALLEYRLTLANDARAVAEISAEVLRKLGPERAVLVELSSDKKNVRERLGGYLLEIDEPHLAVEVLEHGGPSHHGSSPFRAELAARALAKLGRHAEALERVRWARHQRPSRPGPYILEASLLTALGQDDEGNALLVFGETQVRDPWPLLLLRSQRLYKAGRYPQARQQIARLVRTAESPQRIGMAYWMNGRLHTTENNHAAAAANYELAHEAAPYEFRYLAAVVQARLANREIDAARRRLQSSRHLLRSDDYNRLAAEISKVSLAGPGQKTANPAGERFAP